MTTTNPPAVKTRAFVSEYMSGHRYGSASGLTDSGNPHTTSQAEMKTAFLEEFKNATFAVDLTAQGTPLQANLGDVQRVLDHLRVTHETLFADSHSAIEVPQLSCGSFKAEVDSYEPLTHFLNTIIHAANSCLTGPRYLEALCFYPHGAEM